MAIESDYRELFSETVTLRPRASIDGYGKPTFATGASVPAHLIDAREIMPGADGRDKVQTGIAYLYGTPACDTTYSLRLADGSDVVILSVDVRYAEDGPHHTVVRFGKGGG